MEPDGWREFWIIMTVVAFYAILAATFVVCVFWFLFGMEAFRKEKVRVNIDKQRQLLNISKEKEDDRRQNSGGAP